MTDLMTEIDGKDLPTEHTPNAAAPDADLPAVVPMSEILRVMGVSRTAIKNWVREGKFPERIKDWPGREWTWSRAVIAPYFERLLMNK